MARPVVCPAFKRREILLPNGRTEFRTFRPGFRQCLDLLASGQHDGFMVLDLDRAFRDPRDLEDTIDVVEEKRIPVESVTGSLKLSNDAEIAMARVMVAMGNKSSRDTARRVALARERQAKAGEYGGGRRPFGFDDDGVTKRGAECEVIADCSERVVQGAKLKALALDLRTRGVPTVTGAKWSGETLRDILLRPRNAGRMVIDPPPEADVEESDLDPFHGPIVRCVCRTRSGHLNFQLQASHAAVDGWGHQVLVDELASTYAALIRGERVEVEPRTQMRTWVSWQRQVLAATGSRLASVWADIVRDARLEPPPALRPETPLHESGIVWTSGPGLWYRMRAASRDLSSSPTVLLLALYAQAADAAESGRPAAIRLPYLNRDVQGSLRVVGNLTTQLLIPLTDLAGRSVRQACGELRRRMAIAIAALPMPFSLTIGNVWDLPAIRPVNCWIPMFSVHPEDEHDQHPLAGIRIAEAWSRRATPKTELIVVPGGGTVNVQANWRGLPGVEAQRFGEIVDGFLARLRQT
jgi:DNA invertase Pin-like site-specific DNA recombinase